MRIEAADIFVTALIIIVAMGQEGLNYWRGHEVYKCIFELLDDWMILLINESFFYRLVHVTMVPSFQGKKETNVWIGSSEVMLGTDGSHDIGSATIKSWIAIESHVGGHLNNVCDSAKKEHLLSGVLFMANCTTLHYTTLQSVIVHGALISYMVENDSDHNVCQSVIGRPPNGSTNRETGKVLIGDKLTSYSPSFYWRVRSSYNINSFFFFFFFFYLVRNQPTRLKLFFFFLFKYVAWLTQPPWFCI